MGIEITNQINEQECGVCALTSLHNHYYSHSKVQKENVLNECQISSGGMSIFDFEVCAKKLGLECESYDVKWSEFINLKINSYFVLLVGTSNNTSHYVIVKKHKRYFEIYDSCLPEPTKLKYSELKKNFLNVLILISKKPNKTFNSVFGKAKTLLMFDLKFVILNILLSTILLGISILAATYLNWIIDHAIVNNSVRNLLTISFIFIFVYISNNLLNYIANLYCSGHLKSYFLLFTNKILGCLQKKKFTFFDKVDRNWIYKVDECVFNISNFCVIQINKVITNILFSVICICIIGIVQYYLLIFALIIPLIQFIFFTISYRKKKDMFISVVRTENKNNEIYKRIISTINNEQWNDKKINLVNKIKDNYSSIYKNFHDATLFKGNTSLFKSILKSIVEIALITTIAYLVMKNMNISIGSMMFVISAFGLYTSATNEIFDYFLSKIEFEVYWQVYKDITEVDNLSTDKFIYIDEEIKTIKFVNDNYEAQFLSNKDNYCNVPVIELFKNCNSIYLNDQKLDKSNLNSFSNIIVCDENSSLDIDYFLKQFELHPETYAPFIRYFQINLNEPNQTFLKTIVLNLLSLIHEKDKVIVIDSILGMFASKDKLMIKDIVNKIQKNNYVFIIRKDEND